MMRFGSLRYTVYLYNRQIRQVNIRFLVRALFWFWHTKGERHDCTREFGNFQKEDNILKRWLNFYSDQTTANINQHDAC